VALGVGPLVGIVLPRQRPFEVLSSVRVLMAHAPDTSFPSDHAILVGALTVGLWALSQRLDVGLAFVGFTVVVARVYIGVHYPSNLIGGVLLGALVGAAVRRVAKHAAAPAPNFDFDLLHRPRPRRPPTR
jgi:undecaprenyl-diphosphatase